jgi:hypothetical protein
VNAWLIIVMTHCTILLRGRISYCIALDLPGRAMRRKAMKVILQDYEPRPQLFRETEAAKPVVRKARLRLTPAPAELRLFHAL